MHWCCCHFRWSSKATSSMWMWMSSGNDVLLLRLSHVITNWARRKNISKCEHTWIVTVGWLSTAVEKTCDFFVGITVFRPMSLVMTPPTVSMPIVRGLTSRSTRSPVSSSPPSTPACTAAPYATASSGLIPRLGSCSYPKNPTSTIYAQL